MNKIIQVSGFGIDDKQTGTNYLLVALTDDGKVLLSAGDGRWTSVYPKPPEDKKGKGFFEAVSDAITAHKEDK